MHAVVLAGGQGTRLRPYTSMLPKPLLPLGGRPILGVILSQLAAHGVRTVTVAAGRNASLLGAYVGDGRRWGLSIECATEETPLGTAGPLLPLLGRLPEQFLVVNGDVLTDLNFAALLGLHMSNHCALTIAVGERTTNLGFGVVESAAGRVVRFREKPALRHEVSMGAYALSRDALHRYRPGRPMGFDELIIDLMGGGDPPAVFRWDGYWLDIGTPQDYERANLEFGPAASRLMPAPARAAPRVRDPGCTETTRVLLLGATGFVGRQVAHALTAHPHVSVVTSGSRDSEDGLDLVADGIADLATLIERVRPHAVVNCAGVTAGSPDELVTSNVVLVGNVIEAMRQADVGASLVHLGSAAEYGSAGCGTAVRESTAPCPVDAYGVTKLVGSQLVTEASDNGDVVGTVLRLFNVVGPGSPTNSLPGRIVAEVRRALRVGGGIRLGRLDAVRDFVDVRDVAHAVVLTALGTRHLTDVVNIGCGEPVVVRRLVEEVAQLAGFTGEVREDAPTPARSAAIEWQCADIRRGRETLGWEPSRTLRESATDLWHSANSVGPTTMR